MISDQPNIEIRNMTNSVYTKQQALEASTKYFNGDALAADAFVGKYALTNIEGNFLELTPDDMHRRLAKEIARIESNYPNPISEDELYYLMKDFKYVIPQGSPMAAIGNPYQVMSASNCYVVPSPEDSYAGIFFTDCELGSIFKRRGGCGTNISKIRPKNMKVHNAAKATEGILPICERYSNTCREVAINGRRGAEMLVCSIHHPEIRTFITMKRDLSKVTGANVSIQVTDEFMRAKNAGEKFQLRWPVDEKENPVVSEWVDARELWNEIVHGAWLCAEPGLLFWDTITRMTPSEIYESLRAVATNPCAEIILEAYGACRLLCMNLFSFIKNPFTKDACVDWELFKDCAYKSQKIMDDIVDLDIELTDRIIKKIESDPEPENVKAIELNLWKQIKQSCINSRRTGLGFTGLGDALAALGIKYGSRDSICTTEDFYRELATASYKASIDMAMDRGAFPLFDSTKEIGHPFLERILSTLDEDYIQRYLKYGRRQCANTTNAPTGTTSLLTQTTSGIEPVWKLMYTRSRKINPNDITSKVDRVDNLGDKWQEYIVYHHGLQKWKDITGLDDISLSPYAGATSSDIDWLAGVELQAAAQKWVCHAISKTCNLPSSATEEDVGKVYEKAWELGIKGFTVYRDKSRAGVLNAIEETPVKKVDPVEQSFKRPSELPCHIYHSKVKGESWIVLVGLHNGAPHEVFCGLKKCIEIPKKYKEGKIVKIKHKAKTKEELAINTYDLVVGEGDDQIVVHDIVNTFDNSNNSALSRSISLNLRHNIPINFIVEQLLKDKDSDMYCFSKVVARVLKNYIPDGTKPSNSTDGHCPSCGGHNVAYQEKCLICMDCGHSKCS